MSKAPICSCGIQMVERRNRATGHLFYGCAKFSRGGCGETAHHEDEVPDEYAEGYVGGGDEPFFDD